MTSTGIDLIQALSEGNVDKINELKTKFIGGLAVIAGTLCHYSGIKNTLRILGLFVSNVARVAFGGLLKVSLNGVRVLLAGLVKKAAMLGGGILAGGGIGAFISGIVQDILLIKFFGGGGFGRRKVAKTTAKAGTGFFNRMMGGTNKMFADPKKTQIPSSKPNFFQRAQRTVKNNLVK